MSEGNGSKPTFNFDRVPYKWARQFGQVFAQLNLSATLMDAPVRGDATEDDKARIRQAKLEAMEGFDELVSKRDELICRVLVDVPRDWLIDDAPEAIDWSDPANLQDYLQMNRMDDLLTELGEARNNREKKPSAS